MPSRAARAACLAVLVAVSVPAGAAPGAAPPPSPGEVTLERIPAVVDGRPLLLTEVRLLGRLRGLDETAAVEALIDERLMYREAARLPQASVSGEEEDKAYRELAAQVGDEIRAGALADLRRLARRQTAILKYIALRLRPQVRVSEEAVRSAYEAESSARPASPSYEAEAPGLRQRLEGRQLDERIEEWVRDLRQGADIRYNR